MVFNEVLNYEGLMNVVIPERLHNIVSLDLAYSHGEGLDWIQQLDARKKELLKKRGDLIQLNESIESNSTWDAQVFFYGQIGTFLNRLIPIEAIGNYLDIKGNNLEIGNIDTRIAAIDQKISELKLKIAQGEKILLPPLPSLGWIPSSGNQ